MVLKKLPPDKDVKFVDFTTGKTVCSHNECYEKFIESSEPKIYTPMSRDYFKTIVKFRYYFHQCTECGRKQQSSSDEKKSKQSYFDMGHAFEGTPNTDPELILTEEEIKHHTEIIRKLYEKHINSVPIEKTRPSFRNIKKK